MRRLPFSLALLPAGALSAWVLASYGAPRTALTLLALAAAASARSWSGRRDDLFLFPAGVLALVAPFPASDAGLEIAAGTAAALLALSIVMHASIRRLQDLSALGAAVGDTLDGERGGGRVIDLGARILASPIGMFAAPAGLLLLAPVLDGPTWRALGLPGWVDKTVVVAACFLSPVILAVLLAWLLVLLGALLRRGWRDTVEEWLLLAALSALALHTAGASTAAVAVTAIAGAGFALHAALRLEPWAALVCGLRGFAAGLYPVFARSSWAGEPMAWVCLAAVSLAALAGEPGLARMAAAAGRTLLIAGRAEAAARLFRGLYQIADTPERRAAAARDFSAACQAAGCPADAAPLLAETLQWSGAGNAWLAQARQGRIVRRGDGCA